MAPFMTHLVVGERVWSRLEWDGSRRGHDDYGTFLFGCLAPDMDKLCNGLEQGTTHFLPKDEAGDYAWQRSQRLLDHPAEYLRAPFGRLSASEQAFVLGYLCHVATDEISGRHALRIQDQLTVRGGALPNVDAILTVMDGRFWAMADDPRGITAALSGAAIPEGTMLFAPPVCLGAMYQIVLPHVCDGGGLDSYLDMVRRERYWMRSWASGSTAGLTEDAGLESDLADYRRRLEEDLPASGRLVNTMELEPILEEAVVHSYDRCARMCSHASDGEMG